MMESFDYHVVGTVHNFGVFKNSGKKVILQIDFKTNKVSLIKRGAIQYKCDFDDLSYDSEEGVLFCIKVGGKQIELTAENLEEKTAICRLLSIVQCNAADLVKRELRGSSGGFTDDVVRTRTTSVIKEGVLEKKGNATIQLWAKRKVKVTPGMFSYFKTDEQSALNVVPLKPNQYHVKSVGNSGFNVIFPKRTYYFRLTSSNAPSSQTERNEWIRAFTTACQEKRRTVIDFEFSGLEPTHQPNNKFILSVGSLSQSDDSLYDQVYAEEGVKSTEIHTESETQTEEEARLSTVPKTEILKCVTKDRPKKNSEKQPLVAVKSIITEESEQERNEQVTANQDVTESENVPIVNDLYDVVKDIRYSSSEDNLSEGHEEMVCPEGDYAYPEEGLRNPQKGSDETEAACPTYEDITEETKPSELKTAQEIKDDYPETALYSEVRKISQDADSGNRSDVSSDEKELKESPVYAQSLKRKQHPRRDSLKQREVLPPPPPPPMSPIPLQPPSQVVTESHNEDKNQERKPRKKSLIRPPSQPPPPPSSKDRQSTSSGTSDLSRSSASDNIEPQKTGADLPPTQLTPPKDRQSTSSFSSDLSQSSAEKSAISSEVEQEESADTSASESPKDRLSFSQFIISSLSDFSLASELESSAILSSANSKQVSLDRDEQTSVVNNEPKSVETNESTSIVNKEQTPITNTDSSSVDNSDPLSDTKLETAETNNQESLVNNEEMSVDKDESIPVCNEDNEATSVDNRDLVSTETGDQRFSIPVHPLPQWPPPSENDSLPPQQPSHIPVPPPPPSIPHAPPPPPAPTTKRPTKLRTLHWSKLSKSQVKSSFWKHANDRKSNINTEMILHHFSVVDDSQQQLKSEQTFPGTKLLLDATRARNLGIILTGLKAEGARHIREVLNSVTEDEYFPAEKLTTIRRYQPTSDDIELFKLYSDKKSTLDPVDRFMCELCEIECIGTRLDFILLLWDFPRQLKCTNESIEELSQACSDLKTNTHLVQLMEYILAIGNYMNNDHKNHGFPVTSLKMFMDMRGKTTDFTFSHFLVELLEEKDPEVIKWIQTMDSVTKCKNINIKALVVEIDVLKSDLTKLKKNLKTLKSKIKKPNEMETEFLHKAQLLLVDFESSMHALEKESTRIQATYRHLLEYFGESASVPSNELFSVLSDFAQKFRKSVDDIERRKRYQALRQNSLL